ncbi:MAG TPA: hypothetical protein VIG06_17720 [Kofleriaceae bacterium]
MRARVASLVAVVVLGWLARSVCAEGAPPLSRYFSVAELRRAHPEMVRGRGYHGALHSTSARRMEYDFARARGVSHQVATFLSEVALLHDWDPHRRPETPARVDATLELLAADFAGERALIKGYRGRSVLRERFGWTDRDLAVGLALIRRTTHPFDDAAAGDYEKRLRRLSPADQRLVLQEGAYLSEYADKASTYAMRAPSGVRRAQRGLVREINSAAGARVMTVEGLGSASFLGAIGTRSAYARDRAIARRLGIRVSYTTRRAAFRRMPSRYGERFDDALSRAERARRPRGGGGSGRTARRGSAGARSGAARSRW